MKPKIIALGIIKALAIVAGVILLLWFLYKIQVIFLYIGVAAVISLIGRPIILFLKNKLNFKNNFAAFITLLMVISVIIGLLWIFVPIIIEESQAISEIDFEGVKTDLNELNIQASDYLGVEQIDIVEAIKRTEYVKNFDTEVVPSFIDIFFGNVGSAIIGFFSVIFISFFLLKDESMVIHTVTVFAREENEKRFVLVFNKTKELLSRYFIGLTFQILILTIFYSVLLLFFKIENVLAIAVICAFLNIVPYLGPLIGYVVMVLVITSNNLGADFSSQLLPLLIYLTIGYGIAQLFDNFISQPVIFGKSVRSHPLEIFLAILIGGFIFGVAGMILAVPTYTVIKVVSKEFFSEYKIVKRLTQNL
ncbi:AI-2E family transporter [Patiriisocius marinistellae]|uniref:AI-2E family transporter n=1 Tax=Patiriisocius marinistellae TaxID=2494560 RepID=A0A5J4FUK2_9FLAO|nr:AI-2E family transporter [Patiriisocius marinistellae]GEQ86307.1 AI-2E family transporter [Patiriisocius marinistellae]